MVKDQILKLRSEGKSYKQIVKLLGCSQGLVTVYCSKNGKSLHRARQARRREYLRQTVYDLKMSRGGKCESCGYDKCMDALHFHHIDPSNKSKESRHGLTKLSSIKKIMDEAAKCDLICANCHSEIHHAERKLAENASAALAFED